MTAAPLPEPHTTVLSIHITVPTQRFDRASLAFSTAVYDAHLAACVTSPNYTNDSDAGQRFSAAVLAASETFVTELMHLFRVRLAGSEVDFMTLSALTPLVLDCIRSVVKELCTEHPESELATALSTYAVAKSKSILSSPDFRSTLSTLLTTQLRTDNP